MSRPCARYNLCWNFPPASEDKLAGTALTEGSSTLTPTPAVLRAPTPTLAIAPSLHNKLFKQFMKAYLKAKVPNWIKVDLKPCKQPLKTRFPELYYSNLHIDCYQFYQ